MQLFSIDAQKASPCNDLLKFDDCCEYICESDVKMNRDCQIKCIGTLMKMVDDQDSDLLPDLPEEEIPELPECDEKC